MKRKMSLSTSVRWALLFILLKFDCLCAQLWNLKLLSLLSLLITNCFSLMFLCYLLIKESVQKNTCPMYPAESHLFISPATTAEHCKLLKNNGEKKTCINSITGVKVSAYSTDLFYFRSLMCFFYISHTVSSWLEPIRRIFCGFLDFQD